MRAELSDAELRRYFIGLDKDFLDALENDIRVDFYISKLVSRASFFVLKINNLVSGMIAFYHTNNFLFISHLSVLPEFRSKGMGGMLLDKFCQGYIGMEIRLEVLETNAPALRLYKGAGFQISAKSGDKLVMKRKSRDFDLEATNESGRQYRYYTDHIVREKFLLRVGKLLRPHKPALEIGSHDGSMTEQLLGIYNYLSVLEPSNQMADVVRSKFGDRVRAFNVTLDDFLSYREFDDIFLVHVLEHLERPIQSLKHLRDHMNQDSRLFVLVPNAFALSRIIAVKMGLLADELEILESEKVQGHLRNYDSSTLKAHVEEAGFEIIDSGGVLLKPLANFQMDTALDANLISKEYVDALDKLSLVSDFGTASIFVVARPR
jgi:ribosomal protein S18 acetylase RimI-like enzyme